MPAAGDMLECVATAMKDEGGPPFVVEVIGVRDSPRSGFSVAGQLRPVTNAHTNRWGKRCLIAVSDVNEVLIYVYDPDNRDVQVRDNLVHVREWKFVGICEPLGEAEAHVVRSHCSGQQARGGASLKARTRTQGLAGDAGCDLTQCLHVECTRTISVSELKANPEGFARAKQRAVELSDQTGSRCVVCCAAPTLNCEEVVLAAPWNKCSDCPHYMCWNHRFGEVDAGSLQCIHCGNPPVVSGRAAPSIAVEVARRAHGSQPPVASGQAAPPTAGEVAPKAPARGDEVDSEEEGEEELQQLPDVAIEVLSNSDLQSDEDVIP